MTFTHAMKYRMRLLALSSLLCHGAWLQAAEEVEKKTARLVSNPVGGSEIVDMMSALVLVLAVIVAIAWLFKKYGNAGVFSKGPVQVIGGVSLGSREKAVLLQVEGERLLIGVAAGSVRTLHVLKPAELLDEELTDEPVTSNSPIESFADKLRRSVQRGEDK
ncbi:MAG: flagellar biosynthetic protein FliO [Chromatiales bacterium]|jgi:flagellar protein FliO/FliZ